MKSLEELLDSGSGFLSRAIDVLFIQNPTRTSIGVLLGIVLNGALRVLRPAIAVLQKLDFAYVTNITCIATGVLIFALPSLLQRQKLSPDIEEALLLLRVVKKEGNLSKQEMRQKYRELVNETIEEIELNQETKEKMSHLVAKGTVVHAEAKEEEET